MKSEKIDAIRKRFRHEWLLIAVNEIDESTTTPVSGRLLMHSPHRNQIYDASMRYKGLALVMYSDDRMPKGYAMAFHA